MQERPEGRASGSIDDGVGWEPPKRGIRGAQSFRHEKKGWAAGAEGSTAQGRGPDRGAADQDRHWGQGCTEDKREARGGPSRHV